MKKIFILIILFCVINNLAASNNHEFHSGNVERKASQRDNQQDDLETSCKIFQFEFDNHKAESQAFDKLYNIGEKKETLFDYSNFN